MQKFYRSPMGKDEDCKIKITLADPGRPIHECLAHTQHDLDQVLTEAKKVGYTMVTVVLPGVERHLCMRRFLSSANWVSLEHAGLLMSFASPDDV